MILCRQSMGKLVSAKGNLLELVEFELLTNVFQSMGSVQPSYTMFQGAAELQKSVRMVHRKSDRPND